MGEVGEGKFFFFFVGYDQAVLRRFLTYSHEQVLKGVLEVSEGIGMSSFLGPKIHCFGPSKRSFSLVNHDPPTKKQPLPFFAWPVSVHRSPVSASDWAWPGHCGCCLGISPAAESPPNRRATPGEGRGEELRCGERSGQVAIAEDPGQVSFFFLNRSNLYSFWRLF